MLSLNGILICSMISDMIKPKKGGINLNIMQRVQLRAFARFLSIYVTLPRGTAKTHGNLLGEFHEDIFYPKLFNSMSAETREQSAKIMKEKWNEITSQYPALKEEILEKPQFSKDNAEIKWKNGSITNNLANSHTVKGLRRHRLRIEESARINNELFDDALKPVADTVRPTAGTGIKNPKETQSSIHFFTTTTFKNCSEHIRTNQMIREMCENKGWSARPAEQTASGALALQRQHVVFQTGSAVIDRSYSWMTWAERMSSLARMAARSFSSGGVSRFSTVSAVPPSLFRLKDMVAILTP
jgi:hypothetical protein